MAFITADRVKDTSTTTGTGNITVSGSAPFGYRTFSTVLSVNDTFYYAIQGQSTAEWEIGVGTYASTNQFARTTVLASSASGSAVSFSSGTKNVFITLAAAKTVQTDPSGSTPVAGSIPYGTGTAVSYLSAGTAGQVLTSNGSGAPTWTTAAGTGTVTSVNVSGGSTGLTYSGGPVTASGTITMAGTLAVANGGTGLTTTPANGALDIGNGTGFTRATLTAGSNISITNGAGSITIASTGGGTPGGSTTQVQYNSSGAFAGSANLTFDGTNLTSGGTVVMASTFKRNILINGNFLINQRVYVSGTATASGTYMHDRWKSTTTNSNYTFTQGTPDTTITIAAGTIAQIVEDKNVAGGVYTLSWTGTTTARIAVNGGTTSGSYAASPITTSSATAGQTITVEFSTGTLGKVQLEPGTIATPYERQLFSDQLAQCQRYYEKSYLYGTAPGAAVGAGSNGIVFTSNSLTAWVFASPFQVAKRTSPTFTIYDGAGTAGKNSYYTSSWNNGGSTGTISVGDKLFNVNCVSPTPAGYMGFDYTASAEL